MTTADPIKAAQETIVSTIDDFISEEFVELPPPNARRVCDRQLEHRSGSVRAASLFLVGVSCTDPSWDCDTVPTGIRGNPGDKGLSAALAERHITIHKNTVAFGENLGWKGNVSAVRLSADDRFEPFVAVLKGAGQAERRVILRYLCCRFAESRRETRPLPPIGPDVLSFARANILLGDIVSIQSEGHVQQFLVAALLWAHRRRHGIAVKTHHPHSRDSDPNAPGKSEFAGDIEEFRDDTLIRAYEVTVRPDWKNRLNGFRAKMDKFGLRKYAIIANNVNTDHVLSCPSLLLSFLSPVGRDIAVIDILDLTRVMAAELSADELQDAVNQCYDYLCQPKLSGRHDFQKAYRSAVDNWMDG